MAFVSLPTLLAIFFVRSNRLGLHVPFFWLYLSERIPGQGVGVDLSESADLVKARISGVQTPTNQLESLGADWRYQSRVDLRAASRLSLSLVVHLPANPTKFRKNAEKSE